jgi:hypothetical protein
MAETLIAIALVGGLLVPMLFFTSAYFSRELVKNRQQFALYHNTAKVLHTLSNELGNSYRILADSTSTELHYAYYDPVQQSEIRRGYRLTASGSDLKLQRLTYNTGSATWTATTPYGIDKDDAMTIAAGTTFDYCAASDCAVSPEDALSLRLNNWVITDAREKRTLTLPSVQIYLNPSADTNFQLSTTAQELFSTTTASAFGASSNLNVTTLDPGGAWLDNIYIASVAPGLSTLVVNETSPNDGIMIDRTTGRAFFAYDTRLLSYLPSTGLSTIATGLSNASTLFNNNMVYDSLADLLYFKDNGRLFAYSGATGLSTLANSDVAEDCLAVVPDATASRVYSCSGTSIYTWTASTGVSTIAVTGQASVGSELTLKADRQSGRVYFSEPAVATGGRVYTWHPSTGLTTLISDGRYVGNDYGGVQVYESSSSPQVLFTENFDSATRRAYVWSPVNGLSTILTNGRNLCELDTVNVYGENLGGDPYIQRCGFDSNGRVFFDEFNPTPGNSNFYTWTLAAGLTTLMRTQDYRRFFTNPVSGRSYFARIDEYSSEEPAFTTHLNAWAQSTGLSTLNWSSLYSRPLSAVFNSDYSRLYLREYNNTGFLEYNETANTTASYYTSGTTITANRIDYDSTGDFLAVRGGNNVWLWSPSSGLSTIFNLPVADPGTVAIKSAKNFVYFADKGGGGGVQFLYLRGGG